MIHQKILRKRGSEEGQGLVEYALILVLVAIAAILVLAVMGETVRDSYTCIIASLGSGGGSPSNPTVGNFTLISSGHTMQPLTCGATLPTGSYSVMVTTSPMPTGSVKMELTGPVSHTQMENIVDYLLFAGNSAPSAGLQNLPPGNYRLTVTPYSGGSYSGNRGEPMTINFKVE